MPLVDVAPVSADLLTVRSMGVHRALSQSDVEAVRERVLHALTGQRVDGVLQVVDKRKRITVPESGLENNVLEMVDRNLLRYAEACQSHADHVIDNLPLYVNRMLDMARSGKQPEIAVSFAGLRSVWTPYNLDFIGLSSDFFLHNRAFKYYKADPDDVGSSYQRFVLDAPDLLRPETTVLFRAYNEALKFMFVQQQSISVDDFLLRRHPHGDFSLSGFVEQIVMRDSVLSTLRPNARQILDARTMLFERESNVGATMNRIEAGARFEQYWERLKSEIGSRVKPYIVRDQFDTVPLLPPGSVASRTWGIEVETVRADVVYRPPGWDRRYDGSLESLDGECGEYDCSCDCDGCCDDDHCGSSGNGECAEFVSPILHSYNSDGLRRICNSLIGLETNDSPGIHVHVDASDLDTRSVARLTRAYSIISPFLWSLTHRNVFGYCKDITSENIAYWLNAGKKSADQNIIDVSGYQPDDRYHDLNLRALSAHGTIEFRAMGPYYNYKHLVRWAWLCRELVNVSKLDLPDSMWRNCSSLDDVLAILYKYGAEHPSTPDVSLTDLMVVENAQESRN